MISIDAEGVYGSLGYTELVDGFERFHREAPAALEDMLLRQPGSGDWEDMLLVRAAWQKGVALGVKLASVFPGNHAAGGGRPAVQGAYVLFDGGNGEPLATIDGTALTHVKTAADSALGSRLLSRVDARSLLMVGAGGMAPHLIRAHLAVRPGIDRVRVWNRSRARAERLAAQLATEGIAVTVTDDLGAAVGGADIVCCATMAREPIIAGRWLRPGSHLDLVGAFTPEMREADDECLRRGRLFVDSRRTTVDAIGELIDPIRRGVIGAADVEADLYELCSGRHPGRGAGDEITVFKNGGGGHLDLMTAMLVRQAAGA